MKHTALNYGLYEVSNQAEIKGLAATGALVAVNYVAERYGAEAMVAAITAANGEIVLASGGLL